jgi:hypothetical protein
MNIQLNKVNELIDYLNKYEKEIEEENCKAEFKTLSNDLSLIQCLLLIGNGTTPYSYSGIIQKSDRTLAYLYYLNLPETAKIANEVFKRVIGTELAACFELKSAILFPAGLSICDYRGQADYYAHLAESEKEYFNRKQTNLTLPTFLSKDVKR